MPSLVEVLVVRRGSDGSDGGSDGQGSGRGEMDLAKYEGVSPFEVKNVLIKLAKDTAKDTARYRFINVGRGNPDFVELKARRAFAWLQLVATDLTDHGAMGHPDLALYPPEPGLARRLRRAVAALPSDDAGARHLRACLRFLRERFRGEWAGSEAREAPLGWTMPASEREFPASGDVEDFLAHQLVLGALGCFYPDPPIAQPLLRRTMQLYVRDIVPGIPEEVDLDVFATEGCCASISYLFSSLRLNGLLNPGDTVALYTPIFTPYIEFMRDPRFRFRSLYLRTVSEDDWQLTAEALQELEHGRPGCAPPKVLFQVNPTNPTSVGMSRAAVAAVGEVVRRRQARGDPLLVVADVVYCPMIDAYHSLLAECPYNTLAVVSLSKYFGVTGWRLGATVLADHNVIDEELLPGLACRARALNRERYSVVRSSHLGEIKFVERLLLDSRGAANAHTAGLSTPQQTLMVLLMLRQLLERDASYRGALQARLLERQVAFQLGVWHETTPERATEAQLEDARTRARSSARHVHYYVLVPLLEVARAEAGAEGEAALRRNHYLSVPFVVAKDYAAVTLDGTGFGAQKYTLRASVANSTAEDCSRVGLRVRAAVRRLVRGPVFAAPGGDPERAYVMEQCKT